MDYTYASYDEEPDPSHRPLYLKQMVRRLRQDPTIATVLDAGCGGGDFSEGLHENGFTVFGCDMSPTGIATASRRGIGTFVQSSLYDSLTEPFHVQSFDAIISTEVIEHLYSPRVFIQRAREAIRPGGLLVLTTPYWGYAKNLALAITNRTDRSLTALWDGGHIKHWSRKTLTTLVTEQGFEVVAFDGAGDGVKAWVPYLWSGMMMTFRAPR